MKRFVLFFALAAALTGCETVETPDGKLPAQYLAYAEKFTGVYAGQLNGGDVTIQVAMEGAKPRLKVLAPGSDLLLGTCASKIGDLKAIHLDHKGDLHPALTFHWNKGRCIGDYHRNLNVRFNLEQIPNTNDFRVLSMAIGVTIREYSSSGGGDASPERYDRDIVGHLRKLR